MSQRITVTLGGKERALVYDLNSHAAMEKEGGIEGLGEASKIRLMLWAGLLHEDPDLTIREVGSMVTAREVAEVAKACMDAYERDAPPLDEEAPKPRPRKAQSKKR